MTELLKQKEIAKFMSVSPVKIKELTKIGMPHVILGVTPRYDPTDVLVWLKDVTQNIYKDRFIVELEKLKVASCTCTTKSPDVIFHTNICVYRRIQELIDSL